MTNIKSKNILNNHAANDISIFVAKNSNFNEMNVLNDKYLSILQGYHNTLELKISSIIMIEKVEVFNQWLPEAVSNYNRVVPFLVSKMFQGDIFALSMFDNINICAKKENLLVSYDKIHNNKELKDTFIAYEGGENARAIITAEHWLKSIEAVKAFERGSDGSDIMCAVNSMLHINNENLEC